jgi:hypothetical protein
MQSAHEAAGAAGIRRSPRPLKGERFMHSSGASRREREVVCGLDIVVERKRPRLRHSGAMRSIEPGISRFRVWSCGPSRNDGYGSTRCLKIESVAIRSARTRYTHSRRRPRRRAIQYSEAPVMESQSCGVLGPRLPRGRRKRLNPPAQCPAPEWLRGVRGGRGWRG